IDEVLPRLAQDEGEVPARAHVVAARLYREEGRFADAQKEYAAALTARPKDRDARLEAATLAFDVGNAAGARAGLDALLADAPGDPAVLLPAARVRCDLGDAAGAQRLVGAAAKKGAARADVLREGGRAALAAGRARDAVARLASAVKAKPDDGAARLLLVEALVRAKAILDAQHEADETRKALPDAAAGELARGRAGLLRGDADEAIAGYPAAGRRLGNAPPRERAAAMLRLRRALVLA